MRYLHIWQRKKDAHARNKYEFTSITTDTYYLSLDHWKLVWRKQDEN